MALDIVGQLYVGIGGAYNLNLVLGVMVKSLDEELETRMKDIDEEVTKKSFLSGPERD